MIKKSIIIIINEVFLFIFKTPVYHPRFWEDEKEKRRYVHSYGFFKKLRVMLSGFNSDKYELYQLGQNNSNIYLNDIRRRILCERISKKYYYIVHNKIVFDKYLHGIVPIVPKLGFIQNGEFRQLHASDRITSFDDFMSELKSGSGLFLKPNQGGSGRGIYRMEFNRDLNEIFVNKKVYTSGEVKKLIGKFNSYLIEERFIQQGFSSHLYPDTLNTIRVMTMIDPVTSKPFIAAAVHRVGSKKSVYADNWSQGGISIWIDVETGEMGSGAQYPFNGKLTFLNYHPETNVEFKGKTLPQWNKVKEMVLKAAEYISFMPMLGWDVIISGNDVFILEANYNPDINLLQVHQPLLINDRIKTFYKHHKVF